MPVVSPAVSIFDLLHCDHVVFSRKAILRLQEVLQLHDAQNPVGASCVHVPEWGYGTRSSMVLQLHRELPRSRWLDAPGPPCTTPYRERPDLVAALAD